MSPGAMPPSATAAMVIALPEEETQQLVAVPPNTTTTKPFHSKENSGETICRELSSSNPIPSLLRLILKWSIVFVWPFMLTLPLALTTSWSPLHYKRIFQPEWYAYDPQHGIGPKPLGLSLGILAVAIGQVFVWIFFFLYKYGHLAGGGGGDGSMEPVSVQSKGSRKYNFWEGLRTHVAQPEGFGMLAGYLTVTWMMHWMPASYYSFEGGIQYKELALCLVIQDGIQYVMHRLEHDVSATFYQISHKPHHRFINPRLFDAFNGSIFDTLIMIIIPLYLTANLVRTANVWSYMAFGSSYACWLTLIHSEYIFPWDAAFRRLGLGTPGDHHVHHAFFKYNFGHLFMWFDQICGTYKDPNEFVPKAFHKGA